MNIVYLRQAQRVRAETGRHPFGYGCLVPLQIVGVGFAALMLLTLCGLVEFFHPL